MMALVLLSILFIILLFIIFLLKIKKIIFKYNEKIALFVKYLPAISFRVFTALSTARG